MTDKQPVSHAPTSSFPERLNEAVDAARDKNAEDLVVLDLRQSNAFTDFFVICSGRSPRQVTAIVDSIEARLKTIEAQPAHIEGYRMANWVLIDHFDFIVHVFTPETRDFYSLERLWGNAIRVEL
tara:strand:+ start:84 stop:458 length:375 start_codon:yes stop_codon:yes gene_type:complete